MADTVLVRYGTIPEVARFGGSWCDPLHRGQEVVVRSHRGIEIGTLLENVQRAPAPRDGNGEAADEPSILRAATREDRRRMMQLRSECERQFDVWRKRIREWNLELELIDLEWMLDKKKLVLYVLNDRGPDCTKLALQAAAAGLGTVEVQPVTSDGLVTLEKGGGCGSGGCGTCST